jgi:hypothetical protein
MLLIDDDDHRRRRVVLHSLISMWAHGIACSKRVPLTHFTLSFYFFSLFFLTKNKIVLVLLSFFDFLFY